MDYLCDQNAIAHNPVNGVARPTEGANEGKTPAISDNQARRLLEAPPADTLKGKRDRAIIAILLYHSLRRSELCALRVKDVSERRGVLSFTVRGKRSKIRYLPVHVSWVSSKPATRGRIKTSHFEAEVFNGLGVSSARRKRFDIG